METIAESFELLDRHVARAVEAAAADSGSSPVMRAVLGEFQRKLEKAKAALAGGRASREPVVELEQAADSARVAAAADTGASPRVKELIDVAHMAICMLKGQG